MVRAVFPTPPSPSTTSLYNVILPAILPDVWRCHSTAQDGETDEGPIKRLARSIMQRRAVEAKRQRCTSSELRRVGDDSR